MDVTQGGGLGGLALGYSQAVPPGLMRPNLNGSEHEDEDEDEDDWKGERAGRGRFGCGVVALGNVRAKTTTSRRSVVAVTGCGRSPVFVGIR